MYDNASLCTGLTIGHTSPYMSIRLNETTHPSLREDADGALQSIAAVLSAAVSRQYPREQPLRVKFSGKELHVFHTYATGVLFFSANEGRYCSGSVAPYAGATSSAVHSGASPRRRHYRRAATDHHSRVQ